MSDTYRAELQLLFDAAESFTEPALGHHRPWAAALNRARALLAQPTPQPVAEGPSASDVTELFYRHMGEGSEVGFENAIAEALTRWGRPTPQPVAEGPTDEEIEEWADACSDAPLEEMDPEVHGWRRCFTAKEFSETIRAALARFGRPTPQPEGSDIHYSWELHDAEGEWQAGGSAITLESVRREGNHYLQTYSQDGPHTLIIYQASTIEVVTND